MAQGRSTKIVSMIKWIRPIRLSIKNSLFARNGGWSHQSVLSPASRKVFVSLPILTNLQFERVLFVGICDGTSSCRHFAMGHQVGCICEVTSSCRHLRGDIRVAFRDDPSGQKSSGIDRFAGWKGRTKHWSCLTGTPPGL